MEHTFYQLQNEFLLKVGKDLSINIVFQKKEDASGYNNEMASTFEDIFIVDWEEGMHDVRLIAFFHEIGHILDARAFENKEDLHKVFYHYYEAHAWKSGIEYALTNYGIEFSKKAYEYAERCLATYFSTEYHPEKSSAVHFPEAKKIAFN